MGVNFIVGECSVFLGHWKEDARRPVTRHLQPSSAKQCERPKGADVRAKLQLCTSLPGSRQARPAGLKFGRIHLELIAIVP